MSSKMSMMFSQNGGNGGNGGNSGNGGNVVNMGKNMRRVAPVFAPAPAPTPKQERARSVVSGPMARSAPRGTKQLFNLGHIMANPGTPCKACGS
jgi:hypothetical protein